MNRKDIASVVRNLPTNAVFDHIYFKNTLNWRLKLSAGSTADTQVKSRLMYGIGGLVTKLEDGLCSPFGN